MELRSARLGKTWGGIRWGGHARGYTLGSMDFETSDLMSRPTTPLEPCWIGLGLAVGVSSAAVSPVPPLAVWATVALGLGAALAAFVHRGVARPALRALLLLVGLAALWGSSAVASGVENPLRCVGVAGLAALGMAFVPATPGSFSAGLARAAALVLVAWVLDGAAAAWGLFSETPPWSPETAAWLLDASPRAFVMEIAGFDWMRAESVYGPVGTDRISPTLRGPYTSAVAAAPLLVVGSMGICLRLLHCSRRLSARG